MRGLVRSRQVCPECGTKGKYNEHLVCRCGGFASDKPEIILRWQGKVLTITHDNRGRRFDGLVRARRALDQIREQVEDSRFNPADWKSAKANRFLWQNYHREYLEYERNRCILQTYRGKASAGNHFRWFNGQNIKEIRTADIAKFFALPCLNMALKDSSRKTLLAELRHVFNHALYMEDIERVPSFPTIKVDPPDIDWLTPEEQALILKHMPKQHHGIFVLLFTYGLRVMEGAALCWDCVDFQNEAIIIKRTFSAGELVERTKTHQQRALPLYGEIRPYLKPRGVGRVPVFPNPRTGGFYSYFALRRTFKLACGGCEIDIKLKNATRHSAGMQFLNLLGANLDDVGELLGHTNRSTTKRYARASLTRLAGLREKQNANNLPTLFGGANEPK